MAQTLFAGAGKVYLHTRDALGNPLGGIFLGNVPDLKVQLATEVEEHIENQSGSNLTDARLQKSNKASINYTLEDFNEDNLALALYGQVLTISAGTVTGEVLPSPLSINQLYQLQKQNVSSLVITDSTGSPKTLAAGQYAVNAKPGSFIIADKTTGGAYLEPFKAAYSYGAAKQIAMFTQPVPERWLRFEGINVADNNNAVICDLYRLSLDPIGELGLITSSFGKFPMKGSVLVDSTKAQGGALGQFGRIVKV